MKRNYMKPSIKTAKIAGDEMMQDASTLDQNKGSQTISTTTNTEYNSTYGVKEYNPWDADDFQN